MKKYYLLDSTDAPVLHVFDAPEQRDSETIAAIFGGNIIVARDGCTRSISYDPGHQIPPQSDWETIKKTLTETGAFIAGELRLGWFEATPAKDALTIILEKLEAIRVSNDPDAWATMFRSVRTEPCRAAYPTVDPVVKPLSPADFASVYQAELNQVTAPAPAPADDLAIRIPITGGITLESDGMPGSVFKVTLNGKTLASTKPGGQFLVLADDATEGTWLIAAQHTLNAIK